MQTTTRREVLRSADQQAPLLGTFGRFDRCEDAFRTARQIIDRDMAAEQEPLAVIGDFVIPPPDGPPSRDFQTLHLDFGLPLVPVIVADVARFTALHVAADAAQTTAITRLVPLRSLLGGHAAPDHDELIKRFEAYGASRGAWDYSCGYVEGSLARIVEAALGRAPALPSVKAQPGFLCGNEFSSITDEVQFFRERGLCLDDMEIAIRLRPGELLVFDNLAFAHGRRGIRRPGELHQRVFGHRALSIEMQKLMRDRVLEAIACDRS